MLQFTLLPAAEGMSLEDVVGIIPSFLNEDDLRSAADQINEGYAHGGGWSPMSGWTFNHDTKEITYETSDPEDTPEVYQPLAKSFLRDEEIYIYYGGWTAIVECITSNVAVARLD